MELGLPVEGAEEELSDEGSPRVIVYGYDGLPMLPVAPRSPNYIPGLEEPQTPPAPQDEDEHEPMFIQPHDHDFVPEPIYPEYIPLEDEHILLAEEQPLSPVVPPTAKSPGVWVRESVQAMLDQAFLRNSTNGDGSQSSHEDNPRHVQTTRPCFYADFMKCHPLNFKGNEGVIRTLGPEAYAMTWEVLKKKMTDKYGNVKSSKPRTLDETIKLTNDLMDQKFQTYAEKADNKRKTDDTSRNNHGHQQQPFKKQNVAKVYTIGTGERKLYEGSLPKSFGNANVANSQKDGKGTPKGNVGNAEKNRNAPMNPDSNFMMGTFLLNNRYASILFDTGADRSFISTAFSSLVNIDPTPLGSSYAVEIADGKIVGIYTIIRGSTSGIPDLPNSRSRTSSSSPVSIGTVQDEGIVKTTAGAFRQAPWRMCSTIILVDILGVAVL
nr:reverse transcriptase domain-containing protein [Tanacetum cinerariifolium]